MTSPDWRLLRDSYQTGARNMAIDEALLESVSRRESPPVLRLYRWRPATLTIGYGQSITRDIDLEICRQAGIDVVRRSTGGRAVLHDHEVTYAVVAPCEAGMFAGSVLDCYRVIARFLQDALQNVGVDTCLVPGESRRGTARPTHAVCFTAPSQYELLVDGCKVIGSAQKRQGNVFLQHGSIPLTLDLELLAAILKVGPADRTLLEKVGWLGKWRTGHLTVEAVEAALIESFAAGLGRPLQSSVLTSAESDLARRFEKDKFGNSAWTMKR